MDASYHDVISDLVKVLGGAVATSLITLAKAHISDKAAKQQMRELIREQRKEIEALRAKIPKE